ncbi:MAG: hypothetical protein P1V34_10080 [Alphaproteobacteria bacterium]|nr:hypothetical protein [Alphaproteobacteria bacterium]
MINEEELLAEESDVLPIRKETGPILFLSLFLMLLAFFILLNSISTLRETKSRDVLSSVSATFQSSADPDTSAEILVSTLGGILEPQKVLDEVERLWLSDVPFVKFETVTQGRQIMVELPVIQLFVGARSELRGDRRDLLAATANVLSARIPGQVVIMQAILFVDNLAKVPTVPDAPSSPPSVPQGTIDLANPDAMIATVDDEKDGTELAFDRAGALARALVEGGSPPDNFEIGIRTGNSSRIRFRFFIRDAGDTRMTFKPVEEAASAPIPMSTLDPSGGL